MKTATLTGAMLDFWVGTSMGHRCRIQNGICMASRFAGDPLRLDTDEVAYCPTTDWRSGGIVIETYGICIARLELNYWGAFLPGQLGYEHGNVNVYGFQAAGRGPTPLIAAMRGRLYGVHGTDVPDSDGAAG